MLCVIKEPLEPAKTIEVENTLEALQAVVGGYIEVVRPFKGKGVLAIVDEEGRLISKAENTLGLVGTIVFCGEAGEDFRGLTDLEADLLVHLFKEKAR